MSAPKFVPIHSVDVYWINENFDLLVVDEKQVDHQS